MIIYQALNTINGKRYIGQSNRTLGQRKRGHKYEAFRRGTVTHFYNALRKYGWDSFEWSILYEVKRDAPELIDELEQKYINELSPEYNSRAGGQNGYRHSEETKRKISEGNKGKGRPIHGYHIWDSDNTLYIVDNLNEFCIEHDLDRNAMGRVVTCWADSHKGYRGEHIDSELRELYQHNKDKRSMKTGTSLRYETITLKSPDGHITVIGNMSKFCTDNGLNKGAISLVCKGKRKSHKGWTLP